MNAISAPAFCRLLSSELTPLEFLRRVDEYVFGWVHHEDDNPFPRMALGFPRWWK